MSGRCEISAHLVCNIFGGIEISVTHNASRVRLSNCDYISKSYALRIKQNISKNNVEINRLYSLVDEYRTEIAAGRMPVHVDGYCASSDSREDNLKTAVVRSNRVKSELITHKGLLEEHFITKNHAAAYDGHKDMVVVTLRIPAQKEPKAEIKPEPVREEPRYEEPPVAEQKTEPVVEEQSEPRVIATAPIALIKPYSFAVRTNLMYDAMLLPTLGIEWRINPSIGVKVDGSRSWWGDEHGKVQKIWLVNPELRWYLLDAKRFYVGASANFGEYNVQKFLIGNMFDKDTGYQGKLWGAGLAVGYQLYLSHSFSLDFNLGLGYTNLKYDSFTISNGTRVYKDRGKSKDFWGPTGAGINLVWTIGGCR